MRVSVTEPASTAAAGAAAWKLGLFSKLAALAASGVIGAAVIGAFDVPAQRAQRFTQALVAGLMAVFFTLPVLRLIDFYADWIDLSAGSPDEWLELALPVGFLIGALSWGFVGALVKLRRIVRDKAAQAVANRVGLSD